MAGAFFAVEREAVLRAVVLRAVVLGAAAAFFAGAFFAAVLRTVFLAVAFLAGAFFATAFFATAFFATAFFAAGLAAAFFAAAFFAGAFAFVVALAMSVSLFAGSFRSIDSNKKTMRKFDSFVDMFFGPARDKTGQRSKSVAQSPQKVAGCEYHYLRKSIEWSSSWRDDEENLMSIEFIKRSSFAFYPLGAIVENEER